MTPLTIALALQSAALTAYALRLRARVRDQRDAASAQTIEHQVEIDAWRDELRTHEAEICRLMEANDELAERLQGRAS